jgi:hypothetical protein
VREGQRITREVAGTVGSPEECRVVKFVDSCVGTLAESELVGGFEQWDGECPDTGGRLVYYEPIGGLFLFFYSPGGSWVVAPGCGHLDFIIAYGGAGSFPFLDTAAAWQCANDPLESGEVSIECDIYDGQTIPCASGTFQASGEAPDGGCR